MSNSLCHPTDEATRAHAKSVAASVDTGGGRDREARTTVLVDLRLDAESRATDAGSHRRVRANLCHHQMDEALDRVVRHTIRPVDA